MSTFEPELLDEEITVGDYFAQIKKLGSMNDAEFISWVEGYLSAIPVKSMAFIAMNELLNRLKRNS